MRQCLSRLSPQGAPVLGPRKTHRAAGRSRRCRVVANANDIGVAGRVATAASSAAIAAVEVSKAVRQQGVEAPDAKQSYVAIEDDERAGVVDEVGLPLVYDKDLIQSYWKKEGSALQQRWTEFLGFSVPFITKVVSMAITGGNAELQRNTGPLAQEAREIMEKLGPTYIKMGQMMSVRPDVLPQEALDELKILQDSVLPFDSSVAKAQIAAELGRPLEEVFSEISDEPVAAASLAQVYRAVLVEDGREVAVKVQRPQVLETVSKDLYVLRRAAEVYQGLIERFAPQQRTDYVGLLNEWAVGFYTELDFMNEARNQTKLRDLLLEEGLQRVYVPEVVHSLSSRRMLVTEWVDGTKLSDCSPEEVRELVAIGQECFLVQLLQVGFFHSDPHPGNLMRMNNVEPATLALLDFGLMASVRQQDMDSMVSCIIHLANRDYAQLVDDFIALGILPPDCDRAKVEPLMDKALTPYVKGGGAKRYEEELKRLYGFEEEGVGVGGGFQAMTQDFLTVLNDIPFSIPPYFALLGRAVVTLEGVALGADPDYRMVMEAYPFVARKLLKEDRPEVQRALQEVLYGGGPTAAGGSSSALTGSRLAVLLNSAMGVVARSSSSAFIDLDTLPEDGISVEDSVRYLLSPGAGSLRGVLKTEVITGADILLRQAARKAFARAAAAVPQPPAFLAGFLPKPQAVPAPFLLPAGDGSVQPVLASAEAVLEAAAPRLTREEELYALALVDLTQRVGGPDAAVVVGGDAVTEPEAGGRLLLSLLASGSAPGAASPQVAQLASYLQSALALRPAPAADAVPAPAPAPGSSSSSPASLDPQPSHAAHSAASQDDFSIQDLSAALRGLTAEEEAALREVQDDVVNELWGRVVQRLQPLVPTAAPQ